ncbi:hydroxyethylthiazole kinase-like uncharacterized protein yjeF [Diaminobutyricimonas aerilata]|uniref:NAD(P)H-hydrate epimerase n=1 Tax=Diaminobutyricimonas aerilata TaxID=1162967 RepID=A0A2M9CJV1_9MICO|nr:NAD(P)H-hydrate epimerase [Diaminobutyricimonas aerilata]PJJ72175.1 hydroxyethylthiazole kinase-like uncharacterized protein yjeF [Diaminobutyricimonas aerilata]
MPAGYSADSVRAAEAPLLAAGVPLMRRAAAGLAHELRRELRSADDRVLVLVGGGDNGGDALFAAAELAADGVRVDAVAAAERMHPAGREAALAAGVRLRPAAPLGEVVALARAAAVVVDGLVGIGSDSPALRGVPRELVVALLPVVAAPAGPRVVAVDVPSGIHPDSGDVPDAAVLPADVTVTFGAVKAGLLRAPASALAGEVRLVEIGLDLAGVTPLVPAPPA